jgi:hypothetical protein
MMPPAEGHGLLEGGVVRSRAGGPEDGHLAPRAIGGEDLESIAQFPQSAAEQLQIATRRAVGGQLVRRKLDFGNQVGNPATVETGRVPQAWLKFRWRWIWGNRIRQSGPSLPLEVASPMGMQ